MDRLLKRIQRDRQAAFCSRNFFLMHDTAHAFKVASVCQFLTQPKLQSFISPILSRFISVRLFSFPQIENEFKRTPHCGRSWGPKSRNLWIKEGPKSGNFYSFQKMYQVVKAYKYANGAYFEQKQRYMSSSYVFSF